MRQLAKIGCEGKSCPTVYQKDERTLVVQGYIADQLFSEPLPEGEQAVEIPLALIQQLQASSDEE